jgi:rRNA maturation endonuclease Nob1
MPDYECEDCGWGWPIGAGPEEGDECDSCGGDLIPADTDEEETHDA